MQFADNFKSQLNRSISHLDQRHYRPWLLALRFLAYLLVMGAVIISLGAPRLLQIPAIIYSALTLYLPISALWPRLALPPALGRVIETLQLSFEIFLELAIIYATGGAHSPFTGLLYLTIISGGLTFNLVGAVSLATFASVGHALVGWFDSVSSGVLRLRGDWLETLQGVPDDLFFAAFLHALSFFLTAMVAGYFSDRLRWRDSQLAHTSKALDRANLRTDQIIGQLTTGLMIVDGSGHISLFNPAAENILGIAEGSLMGRSFREVFAGPMSELVCELERVMADGLARPRVELLVRKVDGCEIPLGISTASISGMTDEATGVIALFQDISEVKAMEEKARLSDRSVAVAELSAAIAHEIRNPLAAIAGSVQVLERVLKLEGEDRRLLQLILKESSRLNHLLTDFLSYARDDNAPPRKVELCHIVIEALEMMRRHPSFSEEVTVSFESYEQVVYVIADDDSIKQILFNLLLNAFEALLETDRPDKRIVISLLPDALQGAAELTIKDNGPGIAADKLADVFTPFFSTKKGGSGLGLAIVYRLAETMGVELDLHSIPGQETVFRLIFPVFKETPTVAPTVQQ